MLQSKPQFHVLKSIGITWTSVSNTAFEQFVKRTRIPVANLAYGRMAMGVNSHGHCSLCLSQVAVDSGTTSKVYLVQLASLQVALQGNVGKVYHRVCPLKLPLFARGTDL